MVLKPIIIKERLKELKEIIENLRNISQFSEEEFLLDYKYYWSAERGLQLASEIVFDIGNHILSGHFKVSPKDYENILDLLMEKSVISPGLRESFSGLGGFRNILVHEYLSIDRKKVYAELRAGLDDFQEFLKEIIAWLQSI